MSRNGRRLFVLILSLYAAAASALPPCAANLAAARSALGSAGLSGGVRRRVETKLDNAARMAGSGRSNGATTAVQQLDVALSLLSGPDAAVIPPSLIAKVADAIAAYRDCLAALPPTQTATVTVSVTAPDGSAAVGANVRIDGVIVGTTAKGGNLTFTAPAAWQISITADVDYAFGGGLTTTLAAGSTNRFAIQLAEAYEMAEHNPAAIEEMDGDVLPIDFRSLTLNIVDGDQPVNLDAVHAVVLETPRGLSTDVTSFFAVNARGEVVGMNLSAIRDAINNYFGRLSFRVMASDSNGKFYDSTVTFTAGRFALRGQLLPSPSAPGMSTAGIPVGLRGAAGLSFWALTDAAGRFAFTHLPKDLYEVTAEKTSGGTTYIVAQSLDLDVDSVRDFTMASPSELLSAVAAAPSPTMETSLRLVPAPNDDGVYDYVIDTVGTSPLTDYKVKETYFTIPKGTESITLTYWLDTQETSDRLNAPHQANADRYAIEMLYGPTYSSFVFYEDHDVQYEYQHGQFPNGVPGESSHITISYDVSALTATADLPVHYRVAIRNCCVDALFDSTLTAHLVVPQSCPIQPQSGRYAATAACPPTLQMTALRPDGVPPNGDNNDGEYYSIPRPGQYNYFQRIFYPTFSFTPPDAKLTADVDILNESNGVMQRVLSGYTLTPPVRPGLYVFPVTFVPGTLSTINGAPPPTNEIHYRIHVVATANGLSTEQTYLADNFATVPDDLSLWRMPAAFNDLRFGGGHVNGGEGICLNTTCWGGDNWMSRGGYRWMAANAALLTRINHISGEHGRDIGHSGHGNGTDIDIYHFWPTVSGANQDPSGTAVYNQLKNDALTAHDINSTDPQRHAAAAAVLSEINAWLTASRRGIDNLLANASVAQIGYIRDGDEFLHRRAAAHSIGTPTATSSPLNIVPNWGRDLLGTGIITYNDGTTVDTHAGRWANANNSHMFYWAGHYNHVHITLDRCAVDQQGCNSAGQALGCARPIVTGTSPNVTITAGQSTTISINVSGSGPFFVQWVALAPDASETVLPGSGTSVTVSPTETTTYVAKVANYCGNDESTPIVVTVRPACTPPSITAQPASSNLTAGQQVTLFVAATGSTPLHDQWYENATLISGATGSSITVSPSFTTSYSVTISNDCGSATSQTATVSVCTPVVIAGQPQSTTITAGNSATLSVWATGTTPIGYRWFVGTPPNTSQPVPNSSSATISVSPSVTTTYWVQVVNNCGQVNSAAATVTVTPACTPPSITSQPQPASIVAGQSVTLSGDALGTQPLTYQWYAGGIAISGATSPSITVSPSQTTDYAAIVTNGCGHATSNTVTVTVTAACTAPSITTQPQSTTITAGQSATLTVAASGTAPLSYQWYAAGSPISGANGPSVTASPSQTTSYSVVVSNACGSATSNSVTVTVTATCTAPLITTEPQSTTITAGQSATLTVAASGTAPLSYQWYAAGSPISGANGPSVTVSPAQTTSYSVVVSNACGSVTSNTVTVTVTAECTAPLITTEPQSTTITAGESATLTVAASGTAPLSYQWYAAGSPISGANGPSITVSPAQTTSYSVVVSNACGSESSIVTVTVTPACTAASITTQPQSTTITAGQSATLTVAASGTAPLSYQWYAAGSPISGANGPSVTVSPSQTTSYSVVVSNACGSATSNTVTVTVTAACTAPSITTQPQSVTIVQGNSTTLSVTATGDAPLSYQWYTSSGSTVPGGTSASVTVAPLQTTSYYVVVSNACGTKQSSAATVTVQCVAPVITSEPPPSQTISQGTIVDLHVTATGSLLHYQWYQQLPTDSSPQAVIGATTDTLSVGGNNTPSGTVYTCKVFNGCGSVTTDPSVLYIQ